MRRFLVAVAVVFALVGTVAGAAPVGASTVAERHDTPRVASGERAAVHPAAIPAPAKRATTPAFNFFALVATGVALAALTLFATTGQRRRRSVRSRAIALPRLRAPPLPSDLALLAR